MEIKTVIQILLRRWWLIVIPIAIVAVFAVPKLLENEQRGSAGYTTSFRYSAAQETSNLPQRDGDFQDVWLASEFVVNAFTDWVRSSTFRDELALQLGDAVDLSALGISSDNNRSIGLVVLSYPDADMLESIADSAFVVLQTRNQAYFPHLGTQPAQVTLIDAPVIVPAPAPLTNRYAPIIQMGIAFLAGIGLATLAHYFDPTLHDRAEVEAQRLTVLATIPRHR